MRAPRHPGGPVLVAHARTAARARTPPCSTRRPRSRRARRTRCSCTARSTSDRAGASANPCRSPGRARSTGTRPFGIDTPAQMYSLWFRRYMDEFGATNEDFGRYTVVARRHAATNPNAWFYERPITLDDHQAVALDRRAGAAAARLLPGERRRSGARRHQRRPRPRSPAAGGAHRGRRRRAPRQRRRHVQLLPPRSRGVPRGRVPRAPALGAIGARSRRHRRGDALRELQPDRVLPTRGVRLLRRGEAKDFIADGNIDLDGALPVNTNGGLLGEAYIHGVEQHHRGRAPGARQPRRTRLRPSTTCWSRRGRAASCSATRDEQDDEEDGHDRCARRPEGARPVVGHRRADGRDAARRPRRRRHQDRAARR